MCVCVCEICVWFFKTIFRAITGVMPRIVQIEKRNDEYKSKVGGQKAPFLLATTPRCW